MYIKHKLNPNKSGSITIIAIVLVVLLVAVGVIVIFYSTPSPEEKDSGPYFIFLCDPHVGRANGQKNLEITVNKINDMDPQPEFVFFGGDLVDWGEGTTGELNWIRFTSIADRLKCDWYAIPGNHDYRFSWQVYGPYSLSNYEQYINENEDFTFDNGNFHFIAMDSGPDYWELTATPKSTGVTNSQIQWLENDLDALDGVSNNQDISGKVKIIFIHHPIVDKGNEGDSCIGTNREAFIEICQRYGVYAVLSGHTHQDANVDYMGYKYTSGSVGTQFTQTLSVLESAGYRKVTLNDNELPNVLPRSDSFDWKNAVDNPVGDYFGDE